MREVPDFIPGRVSAIVVNYNGVSDLPNCLTSLRQQGDSLAEILVVDNASTDTSASLAAALLTDFVWISNPVNLGFAGGANVGARVAKGEFLLFLNPDVMLSEECVSRLAHRLRISPGVTSPAVLLDAHQKEECGYSIDRLGQPTEIHLAGQPLYVSGSALATSKSLFDALGGFDDRYFMFMEDVDYCWRVLLAGGNVTVVSDAKARHAGGGSTPGGYQRSGRLETTAFRLVLRERNALAMLLKCAPALWLLWLIPAYILRTSVLASAVLLMNKPAVAGGLIMGLAWNVRQLPSTLRHRRMTVRSRAAERGAARRMYPGLAMANALRHFGLPKFVDPPT